MRTNVTGRAKREVLFVVFGMLLVLLGCQSLGIGTLSLDQKIGAAYASETAVVNAAASAVDAGTLSSQDGQSVLDMARTARGFLDAAKAAERAGNDTGAQSELVLATTALTALQTYLNSHLPRK